MPSNPKNMQRLDELIHKSCERSLDEQSHRELEQLLRESDSSAKRYVDIVQVWIELMDWAEASELEEESASTDRTGTYRFPSKTTLWAGLSSAAAVLAAAFLIGVYFGGSAQVEQAQSNATQETNEIEGQPPETRSGLASGRYIARVVEVSQSAVWGELRPQEFLLRLARGDQLELKKGTSRVVFSSGASVILHGPSRFEAVSGDTGRLISGRMTGRAENGNFKLLTQMADVVDLGTEFGVSVDEAKVTDVCVFDGEVDVNLRGRTVQENATGAMRLTEGMALRVGSDGAVDDAVEIRRDTYVRHSLRDQREKSEAHQLSLVDIVAGGDGRRAWLAGAIDPRTGDWDVATPLDPEAWRNRYPDGQYKSCQVSSLIDGVFIPVAGSAETQTNSFGEKYSFGKNDGLTWGPIWSRRQVPGLQSTDTEANDYWGTQTLEGVLEVVEASQYGIVGLHASVGLTVDLRAVRMLEGKAVTRFVTKIANLDNSQSRPPEYAIDYRPTVNFLVLVDGQLRFEQRGLSREDGSITVDIPIDADSRFLTLASIDAGDSYSFDHLVLIDPELLIDNP